VIAILVDVALVTAVTLAATPINAAWKFGDSYQLNVQGQRVESFWLNVLWPIYTFLGSFILQFVGVTSIKRAILRLLLIPVWFFAIGMTPYAPYSTSLTIAQGEIENPLKATSLDISLMAIPTGTIAGAMAAWWRYRRKSANRAQFSLSDLLIIVTALAIWFASLKATSLMNKRELDEIRRLSEQQM
jgi:hypothetical protein